MRALSLIALVVLGACGRGPATCETTYEDLDWDQPTDLGTPDEVFADVDISGTHLGDYDRGHGPIGVDLVVERGPGAPRWFTNTLVPGKPTLSFGSIAMGTQGCIDGLELPVEVYARTSDAELAIYAEGEASVVAHQRGSDEVFASLRTHAPFDADAVPDWSPDDVDRYDRKSLHVNADFREDGWSGFAGWGGRGEDDDSSFSSLIRVVTFESAAE